MRKGFLTACILHCLFLAAILRGGAFADDTHCHAATPHDPSPAEKAFAFGQFGEAEKLYRDAVSKSPNDPDLNAGLVRTLLREQKVDEASSTVQAALAAKADAVPLLVALAEVQYRQGKLGEAASTADQVFHINRCNARLHLVRGRIFRLNSMYASADREIGFAHALDPYDLDVRGAWVQTLPLAKRIDEQKQFLAANASMDGEEHKRAEKYLEYLVTEADSSGKNCRVTSSAASTELQLVPLMSNEKWVCNSQGACGQSLRRIRGWGVNVHLNSREADLEVDSGASGLVINRAIAERSGLKTAERIQLSGVGDEGAQGGYTARVDSIRVGALEFHDCMVEVTDRKDMLDIDGLIGTDVFSSYLVTLDYPMRKFALSPLPPRPGDDASASASLNTQAASQGANAGASQSTGPQDRYIAPNMQDYTQIFRVGHFLILPVTLNGKTQRLFMVDSGAFSSSVSPEAAAAVTKTHGGSPVDILGLSGRVAKLATGDQIVFSFAGLQQANNDLFVFDNSNMSRYAGLEISGFLGNTLLRELAMHIDYRDGLIKFDYDPRHGNRDFSH
jgi:predicted aspartyl protease